jgi:hypothetical protein
MEKKQSRSDVVKKPKHIWEYNAYRATLQIDGKFFAFVTPNLKDSLTQEDAKLLIKTLNSR